MKIMIILFLILCLPSASFSHRPNDIEVNYSHAENLLTVSFVHISHNISEHYSRKIKIIRSNGESQELYYMRQKQTKYVSEHIPVKLEANETINVKIYCEKGGIAEMLYIVSEKDNQDKEPIKEEWEG